MCCCDASNDLLDLIVEVEERRGVQSTDCSLEESTVEDFGGEGGKGGGIRRRERKTQLEG